MQTDCQLAEFKVIYQDDSLVAIHKPAGLLVHRSPIDKHETQFAVQMTRDAIGQKVYPLHRLDKPTSGLLLFALDADAARHLSQQFETHSLQKTYLAICRGWPQQTGTVDKPLKYKADKLADKHKLDKDILQSAQTEFTRLATTEVEYSIGRFSKQRYSLLQLNPRTGRKHQIRRHLNHISHPIIGDVNYGDRHHNHFFNDWLGHHRLYLAATQLQFIHPKTEQSITLQAPLETSFASTLHTLFGKQNLPGLGDSASN